ncbi:helix-turn-helix domain-containing protein [Streptomyces sp. NPDC004682]
MPDHLASEQPQDAAEYLGREIKACREQAKMSQQAVADATRYSRSYVTLVEKGARLASLEFAEACDRLFKTSGHLLRLRVRLSEAGHPRWFVPYLELEKSAIELLDHSTVLPMGILQTSEYAEAVFRSVHPRETAEQIKQRVEARMRRRDVLERPDPPLLWVVLQEQCLRAVVGGREVMHGQMRQLLSDIENPNVTIQVHPFKAGAPASSLAFTLISQADHPPVLYGETRGFGHVQDSAEAVADAQATFDRLRASALSEDLSADMIRDAMEGYAR